MPYYSSLLSTTPRKIPEKIVVLTLNFIFSDGNKNLSSGNKSRKKLSAETRSGTLAARFGSVVLSVIVEYIVCFTV